MINEIKQDSVARCDADHEGDDLSNKLYDVTLSHLLKDYRGSNRVNGEPANDVLKVCRVLLMGDKEYVLPGGDIRFPAECDRRLFPVNVEGHQFAIYAIRSTVYDELKRITKGHQPSPVIIFNERGIRAIADDDALKPVQGSANCYSWPPSKYVLVDGAVEDGTFKERV